MKPYSLLCVLAAIFVMLNASASELPELLIRVTGEEEQQVRAKQDYFLQLHNYFAKRHRIVRINTDVLLNAPRFRITFFDDASITVRREDIRGEGSTFSWAGHMENQPVSVEDFVTEGDSPDIAREAYSAYSDLVGVSISVSKNVYDPETGRSKSLAFIDAKTLCPTASVDSSKDQYEFYDIGTAISPLSLSTTFILRSLEMDRRYHILYEVDPTKQLSPGRYGSGPDNVADQNFRLLQYEKFLDFLGPAPNGVISK